VDSSKHRDVKDVKDVRDVRDVKVKDFLEEENCDFEDDKQYHNYSYKNKLWIVNIIDDLCDIISFYIKIDNRLKWIGLDDIIYGSKSRFQIKFDNHIHDFINIFLNKLDEYHKCIKNKRLEIKDDNQIFETLMSLNSQNIYSRIAFCLEKRYL